MYNIIPLCGITMEYLFYTFTFLYNMYNMIAIKCYYIEPSLNNKNTS